MRYYKTVLNNEVFSIQTCQSELEETENFVEISAEEYNTISAEFTERYETAETEANEQSKDEYIAELEAENAALLYQVLTGEELQDV